MAGSKYNNKYSNWFFYANIALFAIGIIIAIICSSIIHSKTYEQVYDIIGSLSPLYFGYALSGVAFSALICHIFARWICECCHMFYLVIGILDILSLFGATVAFFSVASAADYLIDPSNPDAVEVLEQIRSNIVSQCSPSQSSYDCKEFINYYKKFSDIAKCCGFITYNDSMGKGTDYASNVCTTATSSTPGCSTAVVQMASSALKGFGTSTIFTLLILLAIIIFGFYVYNKSSAPRKLVATGYYTNAGNTVVITQPLNQPLNPQPYVAQPINAQAYPAQTYNPQSMNAQTYPTQAYNQPMNAQTYPAQAYNQPMNGQAYNQPMNAQTYPSQAYSKPVNTQQ